MNIWQIQQELLSIFNELEENGGELTEELAQQLEITQESFKSKCESYADVIKSINSDIAAIDTESKRLATLKKSKQAVVDRLNNIMINAIENFGDTTKSGGKFVDYGTGKISVRNTVKCEVDEDKVKAMGEEYAKAVSFEAMLGGASNRERITFNDMVQRCKEHEVINGDKVETVPYDVTIGDIEMATFDVTLRVGMEDLLSLSGYIGIKNLIETFGKNITFTPKIDKTTLKSYILDDSYSKDITIGKIVPNKTIQIK